MEFVERLLAHGGLGHVHRHQSPGHGRRGARPLFLHAAHVPRHHLDRPLLKHLSAVIVHRHPADHVEQIAFFRRHEIVRRLPAQSARDVAQLGLELRRLLRGNCPRQGGLQNSIARQRRKHRFARQREAQLSSTSRWASSARPWDCAAQSLCRAPRTLWRSDRAPEVSTRPSLSDSNGDCDITSAR